MFKHTLTILLVMSMLTVCGCGVKPTPVHQPHLTPISIDPSLLIDCPALPQPADGQFDSLFQNHVAVTHLYAECQEHHSELIVAIKSQHGVTVNGQPAAYGDGAQSKATFTRSTKAEPP